MHVEGWEPRSGRGEKRTSCKWARSLSQAASWAAGGAAASRLGLAQSQDRFPELQGWKLRGMRASQRRGLHQSAEGMAGKEDTKGRKGFSQQLRLAHGEPRDLPPRCQGSLSDLACESTLKCSILSEAEHYAVHHEEAKAPMSQSTSKCLCHCSGEQHPPSVLLGGVLIRAGAGEVPPSPPPMPFYTGALSGLFPLPPVPTLDALQRCGHSWRCCHLLPPMCVYWVQGGWGLAGPGPAQLVG